MSVMVNVVDGYGGGTSSAAFAAVAAFAAGKVGPADTGAAIWGRLCATWVAVTQEKTDHGSNTWARLGKVAQMMQVNRSSAKR